MELDAMHGLLLLAQATEAIVAAPRGQPACYAQIWGQSR
jgi:hypothetical protein